MRAAAGRGAPVTGWQTYRRLLKYAQPHWKLFILASLFMAVYGATDAMFASVMQPMMDDSFIARDPAMIRRVPLLLLGIFILRGIAGFISTYGMNWIGRAVILALRRELFGKVLMLPSTYFDSHASSELVSRMIYNVEQVAVASTNAVTILIRDSFTIVFLLGLMFVQSGWLALIFLLVGPPMAFFIRLVSRRFRRISTRLQDSMSDITQVVEESIIGQRVVKTCNGQQNEQQNFDAINRKNQRLAMKMVATSAASVPIVQFMGAATLALVIYLATDQALHGQEISAGQFVSFITAMLLLMPPLKRLTSVNASLQRGIAAAESLFEIFDAEPEPDQGTLSIDRARGDIRLQRVGFTYPGQERPALEDVSVELQPGETLAIVGRSGSGKSTLVNLLPRLYQPDAGQILLDGIPLEHYRLFDLRRQFALVSQEVLLFNDSVARNIAYGWPDATPADIERAARLAHAYEFIMALPQGFATPVGEKGGLLSGGQRQRIAIARALLQDAPVLILDEATSALDTESERAIQAGLEALMEGRTTLVIAHRLSTVENADHILVLDQGQVVEYGRHAELMAAEGRYAVLYRMQFREHT